MDAGEFNDYRELTMKEAFDHILNIYKKTRKNPDRELTGVAPTAGSASPFQSLH